MAYIPCHAYHTPHCFCRLQAQIPTGVGMPVAMPVLGEQLDFSTDRWRWWDWIEGRTGLHHASPTTTAKRERAFGMREEQRETFFIEGQSIPAHLGHTMHTHSAVSLLSSTRYQPAFGLECVLSRVITSRAAHKYHDAILFSIMRTAHFLMKYHFSFWFRWRGVLIEAMLPVIEYYRWCWLRSRLKRHIISILCSAYDCWLSRWWEIIIIRLFDDYWLLLIFCTPPYDDFNARFSAGQYQVSNDFSIPIYVWYIFVMPGQNYFWLQFLCVTNTGLVFTYDASFSIW